MATDENLKALEALMTEFFYPTTTNDRKKQIEELLNSFSQQKDAWSYCLFFTQQTNNEYVMMYCTSVLENLINKQWHGLTPDTKKVMRETIIKYLVEAHKTLPVFVRNKLAKLNVDIARHDWPHFYHDFLSNSIQLAQEPSTSVLGIVLLQTTSEEMACPREDLSISRKQELQELLLENIPLMLSTLTGILDRVLEKHQLIPSATPPPSPTSSTPSSSLQNLLFKSPHNKTPKQNLMPFDTESQTLCKQALSCIGHLFSWIPLSTMITSQLLNTVFNFAAFGCETARHTFSVSGGNMQSLGMLAMCCINELLSKNCVPTDFEDFLLQLFQQTFYLLRKLTTSLNMDNLDTSFVDKFIEFLRLFVNHHLRRFEANSQFPVMEFLGLLFDFTFKQTLIESFYHCLDIWLIFVDYIKIKVQDTLSDTASLERYSAGLLALVQEVLKRLQYKHNQSILEELDSGDRDDDGLTELELYFKRCNDVFMAITELMPDQTTNILIPVFEENLSNYLKLEQVLSSSSQTDMNTYSLSLRDLSSSLQTSCRIVDSLTGATFAEKFTFTEKFVLSLVNLEEFNTKLKIHSFSNNTLLEKLQPICIDIHLQTLATLVSYCHWLSQYYMESFHKNGDKEKCAEIITRITNAVIPNIQKDIPDKIVECSIHTLSAILTIVRPVYLYEIQSIQQLYQLVSTGYSTSLPKQCEAPLIKCLSSYLILRWPALPDTEQKWDLRSSNHNTFIHSLHNTLLEIRNQDLSNQNNLQNAKELVKKTLLSLRSLISAISAEPKKSKEIMFSSIKEYIQVSLQLFPIFLNDSEVLECIIGFFLTLIGCLRVQVGIPFTENMLQTFLDMLSKQRLEKIIQQENQTAYKVIDSFLKILELIVKESGSGFRSLLPRIISFCMQSLYPIVAQKPTPDIKLPLYELLYELLTNNWKYFYKSSVISTFGGVNPNEPLEHESDFTNIIHSFGQSFLQPDISIFKHNLYALEELNKKWKLYHKKIFLEHMMSQFLQVLLQSLVVRSHDLLQEDILIAVYNMASVDFRMFTKTFLSTFLKQVNTIDYHQRTSLEEKFSQSDQDLPTFIASIQRLVNDLRYYTIINASLPPGTINLSETEPEPISEY